jgi:neutral ceramidase
MSMAVSTAKVDITPSRKTNPYMAGYGCGIEPRRASTDAPYREPLTARCVILWDGDVPKAIVSVEVLGFSRVLHQRIRTRVLALRQGWESGDVVLQATHTHNGPALVDKLDPWIAYNLTEPALKQVRAYSDKLESTIVDLVRTALAAPRTECTLDYQVADEDFAFNRDRLRYAERAVPILTARDRKGKPVAVIFGYGCHTVAAGYQTQFDGDWAGGACGHLERRQRSLFPLFLQGPCGDQNPREQGWKPRDVYAKDLGETVLNALAKPGRKLDGPIATSYGEVALPLDVTPTKANLASVRAAFEARSKRVDLPMWQNRHSTEMIKWIDENRVPTSVTVPIQVWKLKGSPMLRLALTGGEVVSGYAVYLRDRWGGANGLWFGGYANEVEAYIPTNELLPPHYPGGNYDGGWDGDVPGIGGGSMTVYAWPAHFKAGPGGVESTFIDAITARL